MSSLSQKGNGAQSQAERGINPYRKENQLRLKRREKYRQSERERERAALILKFEIHSYKFSSEK